MLIAFIFAALYYKLLYRKDTTSDCNFQDFIEKDMRIINC